MLMQRVGMPEIIPQFGVRVQIQVHFPHPAIIAQEGHLGRGPVQGGGQRRAGQGQSAPLGAAGGAHPGFVHIGQGHDDAGQLGGVQIQAAVQKLLRIGIFQAADDVAVEGVADGGAHVLRAAALAPAVQRRHHEPRADVV